MSIAYRTFRFFVLAFLVLLPLQFLFAGYGVFSGKYGTHEGFGGGLLHLLTLIMFITAAIARRWRLAGMSLLLFVVMTFQIGFVDIGRSADQPWLSALHPFLAFCLWPFTYFLIWRRAEAPAATDAPTAAPQSLPTDA